MHVRMYVCACMYVCICMYVLEMQQYIDVSNYRNTYIDETVYLYVQYFMIDAVVYCGCHVYKVSNLGKKYCSSVKIS